MAALEDEIVEFADQLLAGFLEVQRAVLKQRHVERLKSPALELRLQYCTCLRQQPLLRRRNVAHPAHRLVHAVSLSV